MVYYLFGALTDLMKLFMLYELICIFDEEGSTHNELTININKFQIMIKWDYTLSTNLAQNTSDKQW